MKTVTILLVLFFFNTIHSQILISTGGTVPVSGGELFYDAGGAAGTDGNTNYTITLSPATPGEMVCVDFTSFITEMDSWGGINGADKLEIFDGPTIASKNIGSLQGNYGNPYNASSTNGSWNVGQPAVSTAAAELKPGMFCANNASGLLTLKFTNQNSDQNAGWVANIVTFVKATVGCNINFTASNTTICNGDIVQLTALGSVVSPSIQTDFNTSLLGTGWTASPGSLSFMSVLSCQPNNGFDSRNTDNSIFAWMQNTVGTRNLETNGFNVSGGGWMSFDFREASDDNGGNGCEALDDKEGVYVQYSINNGANWITMKLMFPGRESGGDMGTGDYVYNWGTVTLPIPAGAMSTNTKFRWIQFSNSGGSSDSWGIDNIKVSTITTPTLTITNLTTGAIVGTSSTSPYTVSVSPTSTTNYQASITDGTTTCVFPLTITVTSATTPTFTAVANVCQNATPPVLPTTSTNSITGTWSPAVSTATLGTATYTFTPTAGQCASTTTINVTTVVGTLPTFSAVANVCQNATPPVLPTTSLNSFTGTWSPAVSTATVGTATYTFTPTAGQCASTTTLTVTTIAPLVPTFNAVSAVCLNSTAPVLPTNSTNTTPIPGAWSPSVSTSVAGTAVYTFTPVSGQCATTANLSIVTTTSILPTFAAIPSVCQNATAPVLPLSSTNVPAINGTWAPAVSTSVLGVGTYTFTPAAGQCAINTTLNITVSTPVLPTFTPIANVCQNATAPVLPTTSTNTFSGTWSPAVSTAAVGTATYTFAPSAGQCASTTTLTVTTIAPTIPTFNAVSDVCLNSSAPILPTNSTNTTPIPGAWSPAVSTAVAGTAVYTFTPTSGQCATTASLSIVTTTTILPTFAAIPNVCQNATAPILPAGSTNTPVITGAWAPAVSTASLGTSAYTFTPNPGQCASTTTLNITVSTPVLPTFTPIANVCQNATAPVLLTTSLEAVTGIWSPAVSTATTGATTYTFTPTTGMCATNTTLTITIDTPVTPTFSPVANVCQNATAPILPNSSTNTTPINGIWSPAVSTSVAGSPIYTFTPTAGQCANTTTLTITVDPAVNPTFTAVPAICSGEIITPLPTTSNNAINGAWSPALNNTTTTLYTFTPTAGQCANTTTLSITVNSAIIPTFTAVSSICTGETIASLPTTSNNAINGTWAPAINNTATTIYTFTPATGQCANTTTLTITVNTGVTPTFTAVPPICAGGVISPLPTVSTNAINGAWSPALNNTATTIYTFTPTTGQCANTTSLTITVNPAPILLITNPAGVCKPLSINLTDNSITTGSTAGASLTYWTNIGATSPLSNPSNVSTSGTYYIVSTAQGCSSIMPVTVVIYPSPNATFTSSSNFINNQESTVNLTNNSIGGTTYAWDFGDGQSSTAENPSNTYLITDQANYLITLLVISEFGCVDSTSLLIEVKEELIYFIPNSFTPDGDENNQVFQPIFTSGYDPDTYHLSIFNRWGELIFESFDVSKGWDGVNTLTNMKDADGTYSWKIEFKLKGRPVKEKLYGHVNLLK